MIFFSDVIKRIFIRHGGFQEWSGKESKKEQWKHVRQELYYPGEDSNLQKITNKWLAWFVGNDPLPEGNLLDGIATDKPPSVIGPSTSGEGQH